MPGSHEQQDRVRERFTRTAEQFARFSLSTRSAEAEKLVSLALPVLPNPEQALALDMACGPGTFTRAFASRVKSMQGIDLTAAMLDRAREAAEKEGLPNCVFECGDATALPYENGRFDLGVCAYAFHHFADPAGAMRELARVLRPGGCAAIVDIRVPLPSQSDASNAIERARDASHETTFTAEGLRALVESAGFRVRTTEIDDRMRSFNDWMQIAGWQPGDEAYAKTRQLMEASISGDAAGFRPRIIENGADIEWVQTSVFVVAQKM